MRNLLVELFVEELPPKALKKLGESFGSEIANWLIRSQLKQHVADWKVFASPRRLAVFIPDVEARAVDQVKKLNVMPLRIAFDQSGSLTPPALKRLATMGATHDDLRAMEQAFAERSIDSEYLSFETTVPGVALAEGLQIAISEAIAKLPIPKVMQYQLADGWTSVNFVRPAHGLVALYGADVVNISALGLQSGRITHGHRFEAAKANIELRDADSYADQLQTEGAVIASFAERRAELVRQLQAAAAKQGLKPIEDDALLDEVTALVERPNVLLCHFEAEFLAVPQECLILTMKANQKYFPLLDAAGKLTNQFLIVSNINPADPTRVIEGNERVVRPRLADAKFFFDQDRKKTLESRVPQLGRVVYHGKLGSQGDRAQRVAAIAHAIVNQLSAATVPFTVEARDEFAVLDSKVQQAARLAKTDLLTDMVGEFPELQGIMGGYYARHEGLRDGVAIAIEDHYKPRFAGDALPRNHTGTVLALADKLETLVGLFGIGQLPTGDKDPFALRRHALGVLRILIEKNLPLSLPEMVAAAFAVFPPEMLSDAREPLLHFVYDRLTGYLRDLGYSAQEVEAVTAVRTGGWGSMPKRLAAVRAFAQLPEAAALAAANKRVGNILKKTPGQHNPGGVNPGFFIEPAERALFDALETIGPQAAALHAEGHYERSLSSLARLRQPVDAFFADVMVNADDEAVRVNRLTLLTRLHAAMNHVADLSRLAA